MKSKKQFTLMVLLVGMLLLMPWGSVYASIPKVRLNVRFQSQMNSDGLPISARKKACFITAIAMGIDYVLNKDDNSSDMVKAVDVYNALGKTTKVPFSSKVLVDKLNANLPKNKLRGKYIYLLDFDNWPENVDTSITFMRNFYSLSKESPVVMYSHVVGRNSSMYSKYGSHAHAVVIVGIDYFYTVGGGSEYRESIPFSVLWQAGKVIKPYSLSYNDVVNIRRHNQEYKSFFDDKVLIHDPAYGSAEYGAFIPYKKNYYNMSYDREYFARWLAFGTR